MQSWALLMAEDGKAMPDKWSDSKWEVFAAALQSMRSWCEEISIHILYTMVKCSSYFDDA